MKSTNRKGFTLIELLIVVVIIGILAAIAIPKFANTKEKAYMAAMKTDLRNLVSAQEGYFADSLAYFAGTATSAAGGDVEGYAPTQNVTVVIGLEATGWSATATHSQVTGKSCTVFGGGAAPVAPATVEGAPQCQ